MIRSSVDLPEPLGPSNAVRDPSWTSSETPARAWKSPKDLTMSVTWMLIGKRASGEKGRS